MGRSGRADEGPPFHVHAIKCALSNVMFHRPGIHAIQHRRWGGRTGGRLKVREGALELLPHLKQWRQQELKERPSTRQLGDATKLGRDPS